MKATSPNVLSSHLGRWYSVNRREFGMLPRPYGQSPDAQVQQIVELLRRDPAIAADQLVDFFGTPQGQLIGQAVAAAIPQPYATLVQTALMILANDQKTARLGELGRNVGIAAIGSAVILFLIAALSGE